MIVILIISVLLVVLYVGAAIWRFRALPDSISAMVYALPDGGWRWLWSAWLAMVGILTFAPVVEILDGRGLGILGFLPMAMLMFVAAWPIFDREHYRWHNILGIAAGVMTQVIVAIVSPAWLSVWMAFVFLTGSVYVQPDGGLAKAVSGKAVFLAEVACYVALVGALLCHYLS